MQKHQNVAARVTKRVDNGLEKRQGEVDHEMIYVVRAQWTRDKYRYRHDGVAVPLVVRVGCVAAVKCGLHVVSIAPMFIVCQEHGHVVWRRVFIDLCLVNVHHSIVGDMHVLGDRPSVNVHVGSDAESVEVAEKVAAAGTFLQCDRLLQQFERWGE